MRKRLIFAAFFIPLFVASVALASSLPGVDETTREYLGKGFLQRTSGGVVFTNYHVYGFERSGSRLYGYIWAYGQEYLVAGGQLQRGTGFSTPLVMIYNQEGANYRAVMHQQPVGGAFFQTSVRSIFPTRFQEDILARRGEELLAAMTESQARQHFAVPGF